MNDHVTWSINQSFLVLLTAVTMQDWWMEGHIFQIIDSISMWYCLKLEWDHCEFYTTSTLTKRVHGQLHSTFKSGFVVWFYFWSRNSQPRPGSDLKKNIWRASLGRNKVCWYDMIGLIQPTMMYLVEPTILSLMLNSIYVRCSLVQICWLDLVFRIH